MKRPPYKKAYQILMDGWSELCDKTQTHMDNDISNISILCQGCHVYVHRKGTQFPGGYKHGERKIKLR